MSTKYLDYNGLAYFWEKIKAAFQGKVDDVQYDNTNKKLTKTINSTTSDIVSVSTIKTDMALTKSDVGLGNVTDGAQINVLEGIQKNGTTVTITNKIANISVPTKTSDLTNDGDGTKPFITIDDVPEGSAASTTIPKMDGTASTGSETAFARGDHIHPTDTSRAPLASPALTGTPTAPTASASTDSTQIATTAFVHDVVDALDTGVSDVTVAGTSIVSSGVAAIPNATASNPGVVIVTAGNGLTNSSGTISMELASASTAGAMSASDKTKLNKLIFDSNDLIDSSILPSYVDDVIEAYPRSGQTELSSTWLATGSASGTVITPETGKIYVLMADSTSYATNTQFRWGGTAYVKLADGGVSSITNAEIDVIVAS